MARQPKLTRWEFERMFHNDSGMTYEEIRDLGLVPEECVLPCADRHCRGWKMTSQEERDRRKVPQNAKS